MYTCRYCINGSCYLPQTNTFQAALVTDSRYSFVLFNYQENDMNWDPVTLASTNLIMGYNLGNGQYVNMHLDDPPFAGVDERFRPDQWVKHIIVDVFDDRH